MVVAEECVTRTNLDTAKMELVNGVIAQKIIIMEAPAKNTDQ